MDQKFNSLMAVGKKLLQNLVDLQRMLRNLFPEGSPTGSPTAKNFFVHAQTVYSSVDRRGRHVFTSVIDFQLKRRGTTGSLRMSPYICLLLCWLALPLQALEILDPEEVEYIRSHATATVGGSVTLDCGSTLPSIFIWGFTKPGTDSNVAVAYNYGQGPKLQAPSSSLGRMQVPANASALVIEELHRDAEGMYTCQALYDTDEGTRITFYFTRLDVEDD
ncbi:uncharacterized protein LOC116681993 [Etheostoma spectabile]|uniref:uncharacterized protein LOC116681993 n=1 Tax=Etheostoma spectabile TaxID=54343 RepID=UPI0013AFD003|nr:uncharacterized protein LOC116681993 [Etheostoma spectabile]